MHAWLIRNLSLLAFLLILAVLAYAALAAVPLLRVLAMGRFGFGEMLWGGLAGLFLIALYLLAIAYGVFLRFLGLCDDIAAIRRHQTGTPSSLD